MHMVKEILVELAKPGEKVATIAKRIEGMSEKKLGKALKNAGYSFDNRTKVWSYTGEGEEPLDRDIFDYVNRGSRRSHTNVTSDTQISEQDVRPEAHSWRKVEVSAPTGEMDVQLGTQDDHIESHSDVPISTQDIHQQGGLNVRTSTHVRNGSAIESLVGKVSNVHLTSHREQNNVKHEAQENHIKGEINVPVCAHRNDIEGEPDVNYSKLMYEELQAIRGLLQVEESKSNRIVPDNLFQRVSGLNRAAKKDRKTFMIDEDVAKKLDQLAKEKRVTKSDLLEVALLDLFEKYQ